MNLINLGKAPDFMYVDRELVYAILPDDQRGFGSMIGVAGTNGFFKSSLAPEEVHQRLTGQADGIKRVK